MYLFEGHCDTGREKQRKSVSFIGSPPPQMTVAATCVSDQSQEPRTPLGPSTGVMGHLLWPSQACKYRVRSQVEQLEFERGLMLGANFVGSSLTCQCQLLSSFGETF